MTPRTFDGRQFLVLLALLRTLGARRELTSQFGMHGPALGIISLFCLLMGGLLALVVASSQLPARELPTLCQTLTAFVLVPLLVSETADALLNPAELSVLGHRPVGSLTYLAAKMAYVLGFALAVSGALNILPALAGTTLEGTAWFYPFTHMAAAFLGAVFTTLVTCGLFGLLFRVVPVARVRGVALWVQLTGGLIVPLAPHLSRALNLRLDVDAAYWSAVPLSWFASLALAGHASALPFDVRLAIPTAVASIGLIALGIHALTQGYMVRAAMAVRSRPRPTTRRRSAPWLRLFTRLTGSRAAAGASLFVFAVGVRDWQFRRATLRSVVPMLLITVLVLGRGLRSPFSDGPGFTTAHVIPHLVALAVMAGADFLPYTDHYKARWVLLTMPASGLRGLVRGTFALLLLCGALAPAVVIAIATSVFWPARDALLYSAYAAGLMAFYVSAFAWLQSGLPFTRPPDPARASLNLSTMLGMMLLGLILGAIQAIWIFPDTVRVLAATAALALGASAAARVSIRILENRAPDQLREFVEGPRRMFASLDHHSRPETSS